MRPDVEKMRREARFVLDRVNPVYTGRPGLANHVVALCDEVGRLEKENAEMLAVLERISGVIDSYADDNVREGGEVIFFDVRPQIVSAIANAKGGAS